MRALARKLEREEERAEQQQSELDRMRAQMEKLRANCPHDSIEMRDGVVVCKDCLEEVAYAKSAPQIEPVYEDDIDYEDE